MSPARSAALALAGSACLIVPALGAAAPPTVQVTDAGPAVPGLSTPDEIARELLSPGVVLAAPATVNGTADPAGFAAALPSFGTFADGDEDIGIPRGLVIGANARAGSFATAQYQAAIAADRDDDELFDVIDAAGLCTGGASACVNNATSIELSVVPRERYLKFEYALAATESGYWDGASWQGAAFYYSDGFALLVGGRHVVDNCAVVPRTSTYVTMPTAGVVPEMAPADDRALAQANLDARIADTADPPATPNGFAYSTQNPDWVVRFMTVPLTCVVDVNADFLAGTPTDIKIVVADANDSQVPPALFLRGGSIRFSDDGTPSPVIDPPPPDPPAPAAPPSETAVPDAAPAAPVRTAPAVRDPAVTPLAAPTTRRSRAGHAGDVVMSHRIRFDRPGRYTFIYVAERTGRRVTQLPGSRIGRRVLTDRYSAPVLRNARPGRRLVMAARFDPARVPAGGVSLRVVHRAPDGTLSSAVIDREGHLG